MADDHGRRRRLAVECADHAVPGLVPVPGEARFADVHLHAPLLAIGLRRRRMVARALCGRAAVVTIVTRTHVPFERARRRNEAGSNDLRRVDSHRSRCRRRRLRQRFGGAARSERDTDRKRPGRAVGRAPGRHAQAAGQGRRRDDRPPRQLHAPVLAALPGHVRRPARVQEGGRRRGVRGRPGSGDHGAQPDQRRQDVGLHAPQGDQVLERQDGDDGRRGRVAAAHLQGEQPHVRHVLRGHRRREGVHRQAGHLHAEGGRERERERRNRDDQPDGARPRVQVQARGAARRHPPGERPAEGLGHEADPRDRPVHVLVVQPEPAADDGSQPALQAVVAGRAAGRLPGPDHVLVRPHRRGADHRDPERAGGLDARGAAGGPARRARPELREAGAHQPADGVLVRADEHANWRRSTT